MSLFVSYTRCVVVYNLLMDTLNPLCTRVICGCRYLEWDNEGINGEDNTSPFMRFN